MDSRSTPPSLARRNFVPACAALALLAGLAACQSEDPGAEARSVCPVCDPGAGGESSYFGGSTTECGYVSALTPIEPAQAGELGYDLGRIEELVGREIDVPLYWQPRETESGEPAQGYESPTRVTGRAEIISHAHWRPDPAYCDGTTCTREDVTVAQNTCADFLRLGLRVEIATLDGALHASADGEAVQWNTNGPSVGASPYPIGHAYANLYDVTGSLELFPPPEALEGDPGPSASQRGHPFPGTLSIVLSFMVEATEVWLLPSIAGESVDEHGDNQLNGYEPLVGDSDPESSE
jgi:hypothetical protein